ncbi:hypothetical protein [Tolypothrix sp. VBCCA 56010]|uniref:hypothetical protein n=1 Tax=Tolypothrix sp. VBCCA 56010 TaxID=3137731 RepID=UPI003D7CEDDF
MSFSLLVVNRLFIRLIDFTIRLSRYLYLFVKLFVESVFEIKALQPLHSNAIELLLLVYRQFSIYQRNCPGTAPLQFVADDWLLVQFWLSTIATKLDGNAHQASGIQRCDLPLVSSISPIPRFEFEGSK